MATYYVDYYNGINYNHGASGLTWETAYKTLSGLTQKVNVVAGDTVKVAKTQDTIDTTINATWTGTNIDFRDELTKNIVSSTNTTPITMTITNHGWNNGDIVHIGATTSHTTNLSANGQWMITGVTTNTFDLIGSVGMAVGGASGNAQRITPKCIILDEPVTKTIHDCEYYSSSINNWSGSANTIGTLLTTDKKEGYSCLNFASGTLDTTYGRIIAYSPTPKTLDLSSYSGISFKYKTGNAFNGTWHSVKLYSDTGCTNEVESFNITGNFAANTWYSITINKGSALSSVVNGISIYKESGITWSSRQGYIDNIIAIKNPSDPKSISHTTLLSKNGSIQINSGNTEGFYPIKSIKDRFIVIDNDNSSQSNKGRGYYGTTENIPLYKREPINIGYGELNMYKNGTASNYINVEMGYNTATDTIDGECWFDCFNTTPKLGGYVNYKGFLGLCRADTLYIGYEAFDNLSTIGNNTVTNGVNASNIMVNNYWNCNNNNTVNLYRASYFNKISNMNNNSGYVDLGAPTNINSSPGTTYIRYINNLCNNYRTSIYGLQTPITIEKVEYTHQLQSLLNREMYIKNSLSYNYAAIANGDGTLNINGCGTATITGNTSLFGGRFNDAIRMGPKTILTNFASYQTPSWDSYCNDNNSYYVIDNEKIYRDIGDIIMKDNTTSYTGATSWKMSIVRNQGAINRVGAYTDETYYPLILTLGKVYVEASKEVSISAYMKKSHASNIGAKLYLGQYQVGNQELQTYCTSTDWTKITLPSFTPTTSGVIEIQAHAWYINSTTDSVWVDSLEITQ